MLVNVLVLVLVLVLVNLPELRVVFVLMVQIRGVVVAVRHRFVTMSMRVLADNGWDVRV